jgi:hypothetical protein
MLRHMRPADVNPHIQSPPFHPSISLCSVCVSLVFAGVPGTAVCIGSDTEFPAQMTPVTAGAESRSGVTHLAFLKENIVVGAIRVRVIRSTAWACDNPVEGRPCFHDDAALKDTGWGDTTFTLSQVCVCVCGSAKSLRCYLWSTRTLTPSPSKCVVFICQPHGQLLAALSQDVSVGELYDLDSANVTHRREIINAKLESW